MTPRLARSYAYCERLARREAGNFFHAFRVLPMSQRRAMSTLYAFFRHADDLADKPGAMANKQLALADWRHRLDGALAGYPSHRLHLALRHTVVHYAIRPAYLHAALDGIEMDLRPVQFERFEQLSQYCYRVASVVGLACIRVWGLDKAGPLSTAAADVHAERVGTAFQLTNILRDLAEDAANDRVYLPLEDFNRFGYSIEQLRRGECDENFRALMRFEVSRARDYYASAGPLWQSLRPAGRAVFQVMTRTYRGLLDAIEERHYDVFSSRVRLSHWRKLGLALQAVPVRLGWSSAMLRSVLF